jgi:hypothetical protein
MPRKAGLIQRSPGQMEEEGQSNIQEDTDF